MGDILALHVHGYRVGLDTKDPDANINFVSHAHTDHMSGIRKNADIICSQITKELAEVRSKRKINAVGMPECMSMLNAGHMLGARQLYIESEGLGCSIVYTGDYLIQRSSTSEPIEIRNVDVLLMDSTYPFANIVFDDREETITSIERYIQYKSKIGCVVFGAYSAGKAQELISICNGIGIDPVVDGKIARVTEIYNAHGYRLSFQESDANSSDFGSSAMIVSLSSLDYMKAQASNRGKQVFTAVATGFAKTMRFNTDIQFALSDHADLEQALDYISQAAPKFIYTYGQNAATMAKNLKAHGHRAQEFDVRSSAVGTHLMLANNAGPLLE
ncbi:MAG: hypothetical protein KGH64_02650 [Candidatus Micrarchaeota archaeon]|nr:hypothetical protein [Candidatus Micrarchaeota archaeon]MDE1834212.1 hypothetical protein [Candidatus Micrarchaeota archaeon]MDE1859740.1 hypothetical protein [Candidatus Micrarchaeota archaeon]